jgi:hypothetical protein
MFYSENLYFKANSWESLWGNAGGYMGFFLGISMMQLPQIVMYVCNGFRERIFKKCFIRLRMMQLSRI